MTPPRSRLSEFLFRRARRSLHSNIAYTASSVSSGPTLVSSPPVEPSPEPLPLPTAGRVANDTTDAVPVGVSGQSLTVPGRANGSRSVPARCSFSLFCGLS